MPALFCTWCFGNGTVTVIDSHGTHVETCPSCGGSGDR